MSAGDWKDMLSAIQDGRIEIVKYHIDQGINPNYQHPELFTTPLVESITHERIEIAKYLLENGADPNLCVGFSKDSPLKVARKTKNQELINIIKEYTSRNRKPYLSRIFKR